MTLSPFRCGHHIWKLPNLGRGGKGIPCIAAEAVRSLPLSLSLCEQLRQKPADFHTAAAAYSDITTTDVANLSLRLRK